MRGAAFVAPTLGNRGSPTIFRSTNLYIVRLDAYLTSSRYSDHTRRVTLRTAQEFLTLVGVKPAYGRDDVLAMLDSWVKRGAGKPTIAVYLAHVKCLFRANEWVWPVSARDLWVGGPERDPNAPVLPPEVIAALIRRVGVGSGIGPRVVALCSVYGLRPNEAASVVTAGCDGQTMSVQTSKGGRRRVHSAPPEVRAALTFNPHPVSTDGLHKLFDRCMQYIGRPAEPGEGWHAIRRSLVTGLLQNGLSDYDLERWMGWKQIKKTSFRYFRPEAGNLDARVFEAHPFLPVWRELGEMAQVRRMRGDGRG